MNSFPKFQIEKFSLGIEKFDSHLLHFFFFLGSPSAFVVFFVPIVDQTVTDIGGLRCEFDILIVKVVDDLMKLANDALNASGGQFFLFH